MGLLVLVLTSEFFLEKAPGELTCLRASGLLLLSGVVLRPVVPRLTWQVGHSLTNLEINSFGTLFGRVNSNT